MLIDELIIKVHFIEIFSLETLLYLLRINIKVKSYRLFLLIFVKLLIRYVYFFLHKVIQGIRVRKEFLSSMEIYKF